jgi:hypothetical protein
VPTKRIVDTKTGKGAASPVSKHSPLHLTVTGVDRIPTAGVAAVVLDVSALKPSKNGSLTVVPAGTAPHHLVSVSLRRHAPSTGLVTVKPGNKGRVTISTDHGHTDLAVDVIGYDAKPGATGAGASLRTVHPVKVLDTATGSPGSARPVTPGNPRNVTVLGVGQVPKNDVTAVLAELTASHSSHNGSVTAYPAGSAPPTTTSLSAYRHQQQSALAVIRPGRDGKITLAVSHGHTDLTVDVIGYEASFGSKKATDTYQPLAGTRLLDTTSNVGSHHAKIHAHTTIQIPVAGQGGVPTSGAVATVLTVVASHASHSGSLHVRPDGHHHPVSVAVQRHTTGSTTVLVPLGNGGRVDVALTKGRTDLAVDVDGYTTADPATQPVQQLTATANSDVAIALHWSPAASKNIAAIIIRRRTGMTPPAKDTDGVAVATLVPTAHSTSDHTLKPATTYSYSVFTIDDLGRTNSATTTATTDAAPVAKPVTALAISGSTDTTITLSWTNPTGPGQTGTIIRRAAGIEPPSSPTDGTEVGELDAETQSYTDTGLSSGGTYSYAVFTQYGEYTSAPATVTGLTSGSSGPAPGPITGLSVYSTTAAAQLSWNATTPPSQYQVLIRRTQGSTPPASPTDGTYVATTPAYATSYAETGLTGGQTYSYSLFAMNPAGVYSAPTSATVTIVTSGGAASVCGTITGNEEWSPAAAKVYVLSCPVTVAHGATLLLDPGTIVKVASEATFAIDGSVDANGSASKPVTFTSLEDDSVGGDTNGDGGKTTPRAGDWPGIAAYSTDSAVDLEWTTVDFAGEQGDAAIQANDDVDIVNDLVENAEGACVFVGAEQPPAPTIESNHIVDCGSTGIDVTGSTTDAHETPDVSDNVVDDAQGAAVSVAGDINAADLVDNTGSDDAPTALLVSGSLVSNVTLPTAGLPWLLGSAEQALYPAGFVINSGVTMSLGQGTVLKVLSRATVTVEGSLEAHGTAANPVNITSIKDDSVGGDTNGDGGRSVPAAGDWYGIDTSQVAGEPSPTLDLEHAVVAYSDGVHTVGATTTTLLNDEIEETVVPAPLSTLETAAAVTLALDDGGSLDVESTTVDTADGDGLGVTQLADDTTDVATVSDNTVDNVTGTAMTIDSPNLEQSHLADNGGTDDGVTALEVAGQLTGNAILPAAGLPWVMDRGHSCRDDFPDYYPYCDTGLVVAPKATLTLDSGAVLKVDPGTPLEERPVLTVEGTLDGSGKAANPAVITSFRDDSVGGDTNGDGSLTAPEAGDWDGIQAIPITSEPAPVISLHDTTVSYGSAIRTDNAASVALENDLIDHSSGSAVVVTASGTEGVDIEGNTITDPSDDGIDIGDQPATAGDAPTVDDNVVAGASGVAITVNSTELDASRLEDNTGSNDQTTALAVEGTLTSDTTLPEPGLPWVIGTGLDVSAVCLNDCGLIVPPRVTLTLSADDTLKAGLGSYPSNDIIDVEGALVSDGTSSDPVTLTSLADDSVGGDTNGDGSSTLPQPGDWGGISTFQPLNQPAPTVDLTDTTVRYADSISAAAVAHLAVTDSDVADMSEWGITASVDAGGSIDIEGSAISNVAYSGIAVGDTSTNTADAPTLVDNTITGAGQAAISLVAANIVPSQIYGNSASGDHPDAIAADGTLAASLSLPASGLPWTVGLDSVLPTESPGLVIPPGVELSMGADAVLKFAVGRHGPNAAPYPDLDVQGTLTAGGTPSSPATFTSLADDSVGGDTNGDGDGSVGVPGDWAGIVIDPVPNHPAPTVALDNAKITYATTALTVPSGNATVTGTIDNDLAGVAGPPTATGGGCPNGTVTATPVNWGTPSGPAPYGTGPAVTGCVTVRPWVGEN